MSSKQLAPCGQMPCVSQLAVHVVEAHSASAAAEPAPKSHGSPSGMVKAYSPPLAQLTRRKLAKSRTTPSAAGLMGSGCAAGFRLALAELRPALGRANFAVQALQPKQPIQPIRNRHWQSPGR